MPFLLLFAAHLGWRDETQAATSNSKVVSMSGSPSLSPLMGLAETHCETIQSKGRQ